MVIPMSYLKSDKPKFTVNTFANVQAYSDID